MMSDQLEFFHNHREHRLAVSIRVTPLSVEYVYNIEDILVTDGKIKTELVAELIHCCLGDGV